VSETQRYETCSECGEYTGRAGRGDDSIFTDDGVGPLCTQCWAAIQPDAAIKLRRELAEERQEADTIRRQVEVLAREYSHAVRCWGCRLRDLCENASGLKPCSELITAWAARQAKEEDQK
jgi:hypothetical protein